jgi:hypothetical protein
MATEFYRPNTEILASMALVSLLTAINPVSYTGVQPRYTLTSSAWTNPTETFYTEAPAPLDEAAQLAALESFADRLLAHVVEAPQAALDLLNERFWDLI